MPFIQKGLECMINVGFIGAGNMGEPLPEAGQKEQSSLPVTSLSPTPPRQAGQAEGRIPRIASDQ